MLRKSLLGFISALVLTLPVGAQTLDEIIAKNIEARGGLAKMKAVQTVRMTGTVTLGPGVQAPIRVEMKRPANIRMEIVIQGNVAVQAFDGKTGWGISPFGKRDPELMTADDIKPIEDQADMDGPLIDYKAKGATVELVGKEKIEGSDAYKLKVTSKKGDVRNLFIDPDSYLEIKRETKRTMRGTEVELETSIGDYKEVGGVLFAHSYQSTAKGHSETQSISIDKIEVNPTIDDARFKMPAAAEPTKK